MAENSKDTLDKAATELAARDKSIKDLTSDVSALKQYIGAKKIAEDTKTKADNDKTAKETKETKEANYQKSRLSKNISGLSGLQGLQPGLGQQSFKK